MGPINVWEQDPLGKSNGEVQSKQMVNLRTLNNRKKSVLFTEKNRKSDDEFPASKLNPVK